jgi:Domain of unknown function (DUF4129)
VRRQPLTAEAAVLVVVPAGLFLTLVAAHTKPPGYHAGRQPIGNYHLGTAKVFTRTAAQPAVGGGHGRPGTSHLAFSSVAVLVVLGVAVALLLGLWMYRRRNDGSTTPVASVDGAADDRLENAERLAEAVADSLIELERWPVRDAIIACWLRLQATADARGVHSRASDTPDDFVRRVMASADVRPELLDQLAWLYREARFSKHAMTDADRAAARRALESIQADLGKFSYA